MRVTELVCVVALASLVGSGCFNPEPPADSGPGSSGAGSTAAPETLGGGGTSASTDGPVKPTTSNPGPGPETSGTSDATVTAGPGPDPDTASSTAADETGASMTSVTVSSSEASTGRATSSDDSTGPAGLCGNGEIDEAAGEQCDLDGFELDACDDVTCQRSHLFAFVTSQTYTGSMLDTVTADAECDLIGQGAVSPAYGPVKFRAWYSEAGQASAGERIGPGNPDALPYMRSDLMVLDAPAPLMAPLLLPLSTDETGVDLIGEGEACRNPEMLVWTQTAPDGSLGTACLETGEKGTVGAMNQTDPTWTAACIQDCGLDGRLYCIEVRE